MLTGSVTTLTSDPIDRGRSWYSSYGTGCDLSLASPEPQFPRPELGCPLQSLQTCRAKNASGH